jgi:hypothetical protein
MRCGRCARSRSTALRVESSHRKKTLVRVHAHEMIARENTNACPSHSRIIDERDREKKICAFVVFALPNAQALR